MPSAAPRLYRFHSPWRTLHIYPDLDSTQRHAARLVAAGDDPRGDVFMAETQTAGHGRQQRGWVSDAGGLYLTAVLPPGLTLSDPMLGWIPLLGALALVDHLQYIYAIKPTVKWPNDVLVGGLKLAGFIGEIQHLKNTTTPALLLGMGVNYLNDIAPAAQAGGFTATRLADHVRDLPVEGQIGFVAEWIRRLSGHIQNFAADPEPLRVRIESLLHRRNETVTFEHTERGQLVGKILGITPSGAARVKLADGTQTEIHCGWQSPDPDA